MQPCGKPPSYLHATSTAFFIPRFRTLSSNNALIEYDCCHLVVLRCIMCLMFNCFCSLRSYLTKETPIYKKDFVGLSAYLTENINLSRPLPPPRQPGCGISALWHHWQQWQPKCDSVTHTHK